MDGRIWRLHYKTSLQAGWCLEHGSAVQGMRKSERDAHELDQSAKRHVIYPGRHLGDKVAYYSSCTERDLVYHAW